MAEMCRKLETEQEKVLPFYASSLSPEEEDDVAVAMQESPSEGLAEVLAEDFDHDTSFLHTLYIIVPTTLCTTVF